MNFVYQYKYTISCLDVIYQTMQTIKSGDANGINQNLIPTSSEKPASK